MLAVKVRIPEGLVSGSGVRLLNAAWQAPDENERRFAGELMSMGTMTGVPFCDTTTVGIGRETEIGTCGDIEPLPPHPTAASAEYAKTLP